MFQGAKWIAANSNIKEIQPAPLFRKTFILEKAVKSASLYVCGLGPGLHIGKRLVFCNLSQMGLLYPSVAFISEAIAEAGSSISRWNGV